MCWTCHAITFVKSLMSIQPVCFTTISWRWLHYRDSQDSYHPIKTIPILTFGIVTSSFCGLYCEVSPQYIILSYPLTPLPPHSKFLSSLVGKNSFQIVKKNPLAGPFLVASVVLFSCFLRIHPKNAQSRSAMTKRERARCFWFCDNGGRTRSAVFARLRLASLPSSPWGLPERVWVVHLSCLYPALPLNKPQSFALLALLRAQGWLLNHLLVLSWQALRKTTVQMETGEKLCPAGATFGGFDSSWHAKLQTWNW